MSEMVDDGGIEAAKEEDSSMRNLSEPKDDNAEPHKEEDSSRKNVSEPVDDDVEAPKETETVVLSPSPPKKHKPKTHQRPNNRASSPPRQHSHSPTKSSTHGSPSKPDLSRGPFKEAAHLQLRGPQRAEPAAARVAQCLSAPLASLPALCQNPTKLLQKLTPSKQKQAVAHSPYMPVADNRHRDLLYSTPGSPGSSPKAVRRQEQAFGSTIVAEPGERSPRRIHDEGQTDEEPSNKEKSTSPPRSEVTELTLTYLNVIRRSEDYNRRQLIQAYHRTMEGHSQRWEEMKFLAQRIFAAHKTFNSIEEKRRGDVDIEEQRARAAIIQTAKTSYNDAKSREDIWPTCPIIERGHSVHLEKADSQGLTLEVRWRGQQFMLICGVMYSGENEVIGFNRPHQDLFGLASSTDTAVLRRLGDKVKGGVSGGIGGRRECLSLHLSALPQRATRLVLVMVNYHIGELINSYFRCWLTLYRPGKTDKDDMRELYACQERDGGHFSCLHLATFTRRTEDVFKFGCVSEEIIGVQSIRQLAPLLADPDPCAVFNALLMASREKILLEYYAVIEDFKRGAISLRNDHERAQIASLERTEAKQTQNRVNLQQRHYLFQKKTEEEEKELERQRNQSLFHRRQQSKQQLKAE